MMGDNTDTNLGDEDPDSRTWRDEDGTEWGDLPLSFRLHVPETDLSRPRIVDLAHALKRHGLIFLFFARPVFVTKAGEKVHGSRFFHLHEVLAPPRGAELSADKLFACQRSLFDHQRRMEDAYPLASQGEVVPKAGMGSLYCEAYWHLSTDAQSVLEVSAREVERVIGAILADKGRSWADYGAISGSASEIRPTFLSDRDWERTRRVPLNYAGDLLRRYDFIAACAIREHEIVTDTDLHRAEVYARTSPAAEVRAAPSPSVHPRETSHSPDFRFVRWYGREYTFTPKQAHLVQLLWAEYEKSPGSGLGQAAIEEALSSGSDRVRPQHIFRHRVSGRYVPHPAWNTMIVSPRKGVFCLNVPNHQ